MISQAIENRNSLPSRLSVAAPEKKQPLLPLPFPPPLTLQPPLSSQNNSTSSQHSHGVLSLLSGSGGGEGAADEEDSHSPIHHSRRSHSQPVLSSERDFDDPPDELMIPVAFDTSQV
jgi:hypothetical protein